MDRRAVLKTGALGGIALTAGCNGTASSGSGAASASEGTFLPPVVAESALEGWAQVGDVRETEIDAPVPGLDVYQTMALFENRAFLNEMSALAMADVSAPLSTFFAARINFVGPLGSVVVSDLIETQVTPLVRDRLRAQGVRELGEKRTVGNGDVDGVEKLYAIDGSFAVERQTMEDYLLPSGETTDVSVAGATVGMLVLYGIWTPRDGEAYVAGGAFPTEPYESVSDPVSITGDADTGVTVTAEVSLPLDRPDHAGELRGLIDAVGERG
jgi:hypothetical protein